ncbi:Conserved_hypothetical protein [Hexamita inflata]|uniref:Uncharacterized protein n=1 Tax=Hexamita inflata TaxID=28002 RepID=A0AA86QR29_9EUKA|nr:Conserved hypothetical protein [Hexamita inflata]
MMDRQVIQTKAVIADQTQTQNTITIESDYNSIKSSMVKFEEQSNMTKFDTYSQIVIKKYINDKITYTGIENMITQLCSLAEYVWQNENSAGELRKYNVKRILKNILITDTSIAQQMTDTFLDKMIDDTIQNNTKLQLLRLAQNILKISVKASGCLASCFK